jgi:DNA polymerase-3 subunit gamma/tau
MLEVSEAEAAALGEQCKLAGTEGLTRIMEVLAEAEMRLRDAASKKILVEVALLKAIEARNAISLDAVLKQLQNLRESSAGGEVTSIPLPSAAPARAPGVKPLRAEAAVLEDGAVQQAATVESSPPSAPAIAATPGNGGTELREQPSPAVSRTPGDLGELWASLVEGVGRASPFTRTYLLEAHPVSFNKNVFTIGFDPEFQDHVGLVDNTRNHTLLQTKLGELGHPNVQIKFIVADAPERPASAAPQPAAPPAAAPKAPASPGPARSAAPPKEKLASVPFSKEDFKNDPLIQKALEIFKGQIVEVRA